MFSACDVRYDFIWRRGGTDTTLVSFTHHFEPLPSGSYDATLYDADATGIAADAAAGDQLIWRWSVISGPADASFGFDIFPNGDGFRSHGRFPSIALPPAALGDGGT